MRPKGGNHLAPKARWVPNHNWTHLSQFLAINPLDTKMAIEPIVPNFGHGPTWTIIPTMASGNHQRPPDQLSKHSPQLKGNSFHSSMHSVLKVAGVVHIWYYIPLCTIFAQQFNGDVLRTKFHNSNSRSRNPMPISKEDSLTHHSSNPWQQSEDHSRIPITWPCRSWVGNFIQDYNKGILRGYKVFQSVVKASSISILLGKPNWSIQASIISLYVLCPIGPIQSSTVGIQSHSSISKWPELYWPNLDNTASDPPSRISLLVFHIYWPPFSTWGLLPQLINILDLFLSLFFF
ncbi:hypothetical protein O181_091398 [Austropuccinia psidii MF-1]|uniref:Uncharacterized protein n=1 Tax=Austropuccinia psidii MF-1 TaxID=1389203 RepID=A0A9Q3IXA8_9BASI|nr:hypothetical protein [Austropuccinia psidii MF-1]